jgi:hypothetical protein
MNLKINKDKRNYYCTENKQQLLSWTEKVKTNAFNNDEGK